MKKKFLGFVLMALIVSKSFALVKPNSLFSDNMVLQHGVVVPIWGTANEGEVVTVEFNGQKVSTKSKNGEWMVKLNALKASRKSSVLTISGENTVKIENVLVGEVWVCSGQSNMEMTLSSAWPRPIVNWKQEAEDANYPEIRQFHVDRNASDSLVKDANSKWVVCSPTSVKDFTAVGYFFARDLYKDLKVPIGLLFTSWGGTPAEKWTSRTALESNPELKPIVDGYYKALNKYKRDLDTFNLQKDELLIKWNSDSIAASIDHKKLPSKPTPPKSPVGGAGGLFNGMVSPLIPYAIKGVIWYQGEANSSRAKQYRTLFPTLINDWREKWHQNEFPFLFVQIAPHLGMTPEIREAQFLTLGKVPNTAMAVTIDCGDSTMIHPTNKQPVGNRLSLAARALAYNEKIEYSGPLYKSYEVKGNNVEISFDHIGKGLSSKDGDLIGFTIAGEDKKFVPASAIIKGNSVVVSSPDVNNPIAVRYAFINFNHGNLYNKDGLPASPFRTDVEGADVGKK